MFKLGFNNCVDLINKINYINTKKVNTNSLCAFLKMAS